MKKILGIGACVIGILFVILGGIMKAEENKVVSMIGGTDGPTVVLVAGKLNDILALILLGVGIVLLVVAVIAYLKRKH
ncbi:MAG: oxaloacetate decarboxylase [Flintibacter sp.]|uniref:oxaloacetate decarboxylase n=1 Tax=Flintibacter sp. TaxID=1918624 RepID=UPI000D7858A9|nr:oxaloacetate decarboxylase [Flintibacter sp.]MCI6149067.1 oxaloacetate decarboxylase [Flintibacter sp.]MCI7158930.1 oxaloacetate decarboxylase [Flintibacter sp.]MDD7116796.1 oxaloacetate decarboxylase [Flintibacter sp.]MDY5038764.1 oxaloacetate decarboxylase [Lawsonibacter sp.]